MQLRFISSLIFAYRLQAATVTFEGAPVNNKGELVEFTTSFVYAPQDATVTFEGAPVENKGELVEDSDFFLIYAKKSPRRAIF